MCPPTKTTGPVGPASIPPEYKLTGACPRRSPHEGSPTARPRFRKRRRPEPSRRSPIAREILALIAQGHPNPAIAKQLSLSTKTVSNYVSNIFAKLQVADRAQAIIRAREAGLG